MSLPAEFLDELRSRVSLTVLVTRRVKLIRRGREMTGLCPFHNEKSPSFTVSDDKGFYHCFGCGAHGDAISFVMGTEGIAFRDAVELLAAEAGLALPQQAPRDGGRTVGDGQPKYLNSPASPLFHKGRLLYGLSQAREAAQKAGEVIVVEGYMDVIALSQAGIAQVVAPLGTALTDDQLTELWRLV